MPKFSDAQEREWIVHVDVNVLRQVRKELNLNLADVEIFKSIATDPIMLADILGVILASQLAQKNLTADQLAAAFYGDVIDGATDALLDGIIDFFPKAQRELSRKMRAKGKEVETRVLAAAELKADAILASLERDALDKLDESLDPKSLSMLGNSLPNAQEIADPGPWSLRELVWAVEATRSHDWDQTALLWVALAEPNRDREKRSQPYSVYDVHPFAKRHERQSADMQISFDELRGIMKTMGVQGA